MATVDSPFRAPSYQEKDIIPLQHRGAVLEHKHTRVEQHIERLDADLRVVRSAVQQEKRARAKVGGAEATRRAHLLADKEIRLCEQTLHRSFLRIGTLDTDMRKLVADIEEMRKNQVQRRGQYERLKRQLNDTQADLVKAINRSNETFEEREQAIARLKLIEATAFAEHAEHEQDMSDFDAMLDETRSAVLGSEFGGTNKTASDTIGFSASALNNLNRRMTHGDALQARQKLKALRQESEALLTSIHRSNQKIAQHDSAFNVILQHSKVEEISKLPELFQDREDDNFAVYEYIQSLNHDKEKTLSAIEQQRQSIAEMRAEAGSMDQSKVGKLVTLRDQVLGNRAKKAEYDRVHRHLSKALTHLINVVDRTFFGIGCNLMEDLRQYSFAPGAGDSLRSDGPIRASKPRPTTASTQIVMPSTPIDTLAMQGVTGETIVDYLGLIEQRSAEIIDEFVTSGTAASTLRKLHTARRPVTSVGVSRRGSTGKGKPPLMRKSVKDLTIDVAMAEGDQPGPLSSFSGSHLPGLMKTIPASPCPPMAARDARLRTPITQFELSNTGISMRGQENETPSPRDDESIIESTDGSSRPVHRPMTMQRLRQIGQQTAHSILSSPLRRRDITTADPNLGSRNNSALHSASSSHRGATGALMQSTSLRPGTTGASESKSSARSYHEDGELPALGSPVLSSRVSTRMPPVHAERCLTRPSTSAGSQKGDAPSPIQTSGRSRRRRS